LDFYNKKLIEPFEFGIHTNISDEVYHSIKAIGGSKLKLIKKSVFHFLSSYIQEPEPTTSMKRGSLLHLSILQPSVFKSKIMLCDVDSKAKKEYKDMAKENPEKTILTNSEYEIIKGMSNAIINNSIALKTIQGVKTEVTAFAKDPETGLILKARPDVEGEDYLLDYKTTQSSQHRDFSNTIGEYWYNVQAAHYMEIYRLAGRPKKYYLFLAQETQYPYVASTYVLDTDALEHGYKVRRHCLDRLHKELSTQIINGYQTEIESINMPMWHYEKQEIM
jgi:exodeoxyribonuclease VIII